MAVDDGLVGIAVLVAANGLLIAPIYVFLNNLTASIGRVREDIQTHDREISFIKGSLNTKEDN